MERECHMQKETAEYTDKRKKWIQKTCKSTFTN